MTDTRGRLGPEPLSRVIAAVRLDLRLQWRSGVHVAVAVLAVVWVALLRALPPDVRRAALPVVVALDLATVGAYVIAAAVLLEKGQRTLAAVAVSPLRPGEYLTAKVASLASAAVALAGAVVAAAGAGPVAFGPLLVGVVLTAVVALLGGFVLVAHHHSMATYLLPSGLLAVVLVVPPLASLAGVAWSFVAALPSGGAYVLVAAGTTPIAGSQLAVAVVCQVAWAAALSWFALRAHHLHLSAEAV